MDPAIEQSKFLNESFETTSKTLKMLTDILSTKKSISEEEYIHWCTFMRNIKYFVNEMEFHCRVITVTDNMSEILSLLRENTSIMLKGFQK